MQWSLVKAAAFAAMLQSSSAAPVNARSDKLDVVTTTTTTDGQVIDWVVPESQTGSNLASPPPAPSSKRGVNSKQPTIEAILGNDSARQGPNGTVPIARPSGATKATKRLPVALDNGAIPKVGAAADGYAGQHWYASSGQIVNNHGGKGTFSLYKAYVQNGGDFSLLQTAVIRGNAAHAGTGTVTQTVEAGWINYPNQVSAPHLFSYFTTNGYSADGANVGGWNRDNAGWIQTDSTIYPGIAFAPLSSDGGSQYELEIGYYLYQGNWWLWCLDRYIGYYPASLFSQGVNAADTLADHSDVIDFYGEIYNSETSITTTDMGSGEFPQTGFGKSAYIHNIEYIDYSAVYQPYNGQAELVISDTSRYNMIATWNSGSDWGSYFYLGGPGAGGVING
ncbi:hypothetical protein F5Y19DRAFT_46744 [Xylariaceae sp. FL1651]|nr:hypothetical protein F5Y19DRAFT_46744 [Xylariaceae sp. FL1651]